MAESSKPTITEFLLARISEDEARARRVLDYDDPPEQIRHLDPHPATLAFYESRVLAECAAKRAIIDGYELREEQGRATGGTVFGYHATGVLFAIRKLAAVYADHPDCNPGWAA